MCLYTRNDIPFVSKKDIVVCKVLTDNSDGTYQTPCQSVPVELGETMIPENDEKPYKYDDYRNLEINGGYIHAVIRTMSGWNDNDSRLCKAIIPAGTPFYIGTNNDIAAKKLIVTKDTITPQELETAYKDIEDILLENSEEHDGIRIGDILLSNKSFIHYNDYNSTTMDAIGVVGYFVNNEPRIISLHQTKETWKERKTLSSDPVNEIDDYSEAATDYNGEEYTNKLFSKYKNELSNYPTLKYCVEYKTKGTKKGDWYFPAPGELRLMSKNIPLINISLSKIPDAALVDSDSWYWSSAEYSSTSAWHCYTNNANVGNWNYKWSWVYVRPSLALTA